jgi:hypothetical protein
LNRRIDDLQLELNNNKQVIPPEQKVKTQLTRKKSDVPIIMLHDHKTVKNLKEIVKEKKMRVNRNKNNFRKVFTSS